MNILENTEKEGQTPTQTKPKCSKKLKMAIIVATVGCIVFGLIYGACTLVETKKTYEIIAQLDGKLFVWEPRNKCKIFYAFKDGKIAYEEWSSFGNYGDITQYNEAKAHPSFLQKGFRIYDNNRGLTLYMNKAGEIMYSEDGNNNWREISSDEFLKLKQEWDCAQCDHTFGATKVVSKATCSTAGKESAVCNKCQYEKIWETDPLPHNYKNKKCTVCGAESQPEKDLSIEPDTWYVYDTILYYKNCKLQLPEKTFDGMMIGYWPVCKNCHTLCDLMKIAIVEMGNPISGIYTCAHCDGHTTVKLEIREP